MRRALVAAAVVLLAGWGILPPAGFAQQATATANEPEDFEGLPEGPGREAVYFSCTACHSTKQFAQQRLDRDAWDALLTEMVRKNGMSPPKPWARTRILNYLATHFAPDAAEDWQGLAQGAGREQVFYTCQACHSLALVKQQRLSRASWDETLTWMVEEQNMPELDPADRKLILDYLATYLSVDTPR